MNESMSPWFTDEVCALMSGSNAFEVAALKFTSQVSDRKMSAYLSAYLSTSQGIQVSHSLAGIASGFKDNKHIEVETQGSTKIHQSQAWQILEQHRRMQDASIHIRRSVDHC